MVRLTPEERRAKFANPLQTKHLGLPSRGAGRISAEDIECRLAEIDDLPPEKALFQLRALRENVISCRYESELAKKVFERSVEIIVNSDPRNPQLLSVLRLLAEELTPDDLGVKELYAFALLLHGEYDQAFIVSSAADVDTVARCSVTADILGWQSVLKSSTGTKSTLIGVLRPDFKLPDGFDCLQPIIDSLEE